MDEKSKERLLYRCRLCNNIFSQELEIFRSSNDELEALISCLYDTSQNQKMIILHKCNQTEIGVADLIGAFGAYR